jgi:hypothetical protein
MRQSLFRVGMYVDCALIHKCRISSWCLAWAEDARFVAVSICRQVCERLSIGFLYRGSATCATMMAMVSVGKSVSRVGRVYWLGVGSW